MASPSPYLSFSVVVALMAMFQAGYNPTSFNTIQTHIENFANERSRTIQAYKLQNVTKEELKLLLEQQVANMNGLFQLIAFFGAMFPMVLVLARPYKCCLKFLGTKAGFWAPVVLSIIGSVMTGICTAARSYELLFYGSIVKGFASGLFTHYGPLMISETVHEEYKNTVGAGNLVALTLGYLMSILLGMESVLGGEDTWSFVLLVPGGLSVLMFVVMIFLPETPRYLIKIAKDDARGKASLAKLRTGMDERKLRKEMIEIKTGEKEDDDDEASTFSSLWNNHEQRRRMFGCILLQISRQFTATLAIVYYSTRLFSDTNMNETVSQNATMIMIVFLLIGTILSVVLIKKIPLKTLYLSGLGGIMICLLAMTILLHMMAKPEFTAAHYPYPYPYVLMFFTSLLVFSFGIGPAAVPWQMPFAIMEPRYHFVVSTMSASVNWLGSTLNAFLFPLMKKTLGDLIFLPFLIIQIVMFCFLMILLPSKEKARSETNNKETNENFNEMLDIQREKFEMATILPAFKDSNNNENNVKITIPFKRSDTKDQDTFNQSNTEQKVTDENRTRKSLHIKLNINSSKGT